MNKWIKRGIIILVLAAACSISYVGGQASIGLREVASWNDRYNDFRVVAVRDGTTVCYVGYVSTSRVFLPPAISCVK